MLPQVLLLRLVITEAIVPPSFPPPPTHGKLSPTFDNKKGERAGVRDRGTKLSAPPQGHSRHAPASAPGGGWTAAPRLLLRDVTSKTGSSMTSLQKLSNFNTLINTCVAQQKYLSVTDALERSIIHPGGQFYLHNDH